MPKIILSTLLVLLACSGLSMANECQIKEISPKAVSNELTFKTNLQKGLDIYTPTPKDALLFSDGVAYHFDGDRMVSFVTVREKFQKKSTIEETIQKLYFHDCSKPIIKISKLKFDIFFIGNVLDEKTKVLAFIINKTNNSYFYLLSFDGFSQDEVTTILTGK